MPGDWFARLRAEQELRAADDRRRLEEDRATGVHRWSVPSCRCRTCGYAAPDLTECPHQGERVAS